MQLIIHLLPNQFKQLLSCSVNKTFPTRLSSLSRVHTLTRIPGIHKAELFKLSQTSSYCKLLQLHCLPGHSAELHQPGF